MARGKVGDVVFYRMNGQQMSRVRNRVPKNPRTNEQLYQRAVISTVMKAYSAGKEIFDHAFQGYTIGEGCMRRFNSLNARILRAQLQNDIQNGKTEKECVGRFVCPRSISCTPIIGMNVSEGTLTNTLFSTQENNGVYEFHIAPNPSNDTDGIAIGDYFKHYGINEGDIFTFVFMLADLDEPVYTNPWENSSYAQQYNTKFAWIRLIAHERNADTKIKSGPYITQLFDIETGGQFQIGIGTGGTIQMNSPIPFKMSITNYAGVAACIRSQLDTDLRSTEFTVPFKSKEFGITSNYMINAWINDVEKIGTSELILEGGEGDGVNLDTTEPGPGGLPVNEIEPVNENTTPVMARHKGTRNNKG